jgi:hypothetical protein
MVLRCATTWGLGLFLQKIQIQPIQTMDCVFLNGFEKRSGYFWSVAAMNTRHRKGV